MTERLIKLKEFWFIILFIGGLIVQWTSLNYRITALELQAREQNPIFLQIQKDIVEIKTTLSLIQLELKK